MEDNIPFRFEELADEDITLIKEHFLAKSTCMDLIRVINNETNKCLSVVNRSFKKHHHLVTNMKIREDDVWIVTYPKCGTTWTQEIAWNIVNGLQVEKIADALYGRSPFIDIPMMRNYSVEEAEEYFENLESLPSPRTLKTHYPFELLPKNLLDTCKVFTGATIFILNFHNLPVFTRRAFYSMEDILRCLTLRGKEGNIQTCSSYGSRI